METKLPKAVNVKVVMNWLVIKFDNGQTKYLRSHYINDYLDSWSWKKGKGKRKLIFFNYLDIAWLGVQVKIAPDGTVTLNQKDVYSPTELWNDSQYNI